MKFALCLAGLLCFFGAMPSADEHPTLAIGASAPDFSLTGVDGKTYTLSSFKDARVLVIVFTCNHCPTAQAYEEMKRRAAEKHFNFPYLFGHC